MQIIYKDKKYNLIEEFIEVGHMSDKIEVLDLKQESLIVGGFVQNRRLQVFISTLLDGNLSDLYEIDDLLSKSNIDIDIYLILAKKEIIDNLKNIKVVIDFKEEYANYYGTKVLESDFVLTKALFLIGKDGAINYEEMLVDIEKSFNIERFIIEVNKAYNTYTGVGCHG